MEKYKLLQYRVGKDITQEVWAEAFAKNRSLELFNNEITLFVHCQILLGREWFLIRDKNPGGRVFSSDNPVMLYNIHLNSYELQDNYITDVNNFIFYPISPQLFLLITPHNNPELRFMKEYIDCVIDGSKQLIDFQSTGQLFQSFRQAFV